MDEVSSYVRLDLLSARRQDRPKDCSTSPSNPMMEGPWCRFRREARARERRRHCCGGWSEALDSSRPIREADIDWTLLQYLLMDPFRTTPVLGAFARAHNRTFSSEL